MISPDQATILASGENITAAEAFEAFVRFALGDASHPMLSSHDKISAVMLAALQALEFAEERGIA